LGWLRSSPVFLGTALSSPKTKWIVFHDGRPLIHVSKVPNSRRSVNSLALLPTQQVLPLLGPEPYFNQGQHPGDVCPAELQTTEHNRALEAARLHGPGIVFLGTHEPHEDAILPSSVFKNPQSTDDISGEPYFAVDVTDVDAKQLEVTFKLTQPGEVADPKIEFGDARNAGLSFKPFDAAVFSEARTMIDWNSRNKLCTACGSRLYSLWGGWKLSCSSVLPWADNTGRAPCPTSRGLHNTMHPRTDPVVIMAVLDETGEKILLGRGKKFPPGFYSCLAGFLEPSESFEEAVTREIWEESGIRVTNIRYHSCQPWPFPANLMVGCFALADSSQKIRTDLDNELEDARWFTREEVLEILAAGNINMKKREFKKIGDQEESTRKSLGRSNKDDSDSDKEVAPKKDLPRVPGQSAIAGVLIHKFAYRELDGLNYQFSTKSRI